MVAPVINMPNLVKHNGISGIPTQLLVLHSAECPLRGGYAQSLTNWANTSNVIASWQRFVDPIARVRMVPDQYAAWHASEANPMSIGWEQAGYAAFSRAQWETPEGLKQLDNLAYDMAEVAIRDGIPPVWLTTNQVEAVTHRGNRSIKGFCIHAQIDPDMRTDPGSNYPYDRLMDRIKHYMGQGNDVAHHADDITPAPAPPDLMEEIMAYYRDRQDFEAHMARIVRENGIDATVINAGDFEGKRTTPRTKYAWMAHLFKEISDLLLRVLRELSAIRDEQKTIREVQERVLSPKEQP